MVDVGAVGKSKLAVDEGVLDASRAVLIVDDEASVRHIMRRWLESRGYTVTVAADAVKALACLSASPTAVALCDLRMPGRDGLWLTDQLRREYPDTAVIIATGVNDVAAAVEGLRQGVVDYLTKPFDRERLFDAVSRGVEWHRAAADSRRWREALEREMRERYARLESMFLAWPIDSEDSVDALLSTITAGNSEAYAHAYRVAALAASLARALGLSDEEIETIERGGLLHDVGKLAMPEAVLRKPAPLTSEEQRVIRMHPNLAATLIERVPYLAASAAVVRGAQERLDGLGYPAGSRGEAVSLGARIVAVADAYDTMTRARVFRDAITPAAALSELARCSGTQFHPRVVQTFTELVDG
jgi:putative nucleotidyltransferase with HDIG domain